MGRIRNIKPELSQSESLGKVSREARLLFVLLFTLADDEGRLRGAPQMLARQLYPYDDDVTAEQIGRWLDELAGEACIFRYSSAGMSLIEIADFIECGDVGRRNEWAQKIDRPSRSKLSPHNHVVSQRLHAEMDDSVPESGLTRPAVSREDSRAIAKSREMSRGLAPDHYPDHDLRPRPPSVASDREAFDRLWQVRPKRKGPDPSAPAMAAFDELVKAGVDPEVIVGGMERYAASGDRDLGTNFQPRTEKWLRDRWFDDFPPPVPQPASLAPTVPQDPRWAPVAERLRRAIGDDVFASWFGRASLGAIDAGRAEILLPTRFGRDHVAAKFEREVLAAVRAGHASVERVEFLVDGQGTSERPASAADAAKRVVMTEGVQQLVGWGIRGAAAATAKLERWAELLGGDPGYQRLARLLGEVQLRPMEPKAALGWLEQQIRAAGRGQVLPHEPVLVKRVDDPPAENRDARKRASS